jgi:hypothetical protein
MSKYVIIQKKDNGKEEQYTKRYNTLQEAISALKSIEEFYSKSKERIVWYNTELTRGDLMYFDEKNNTLEDWYSDTKWEIKAVSDNEKDNKDNKDDKENDMLIKYIDAYVSWLKDNYIVTSDYDINIEFIDFLFDFADLGFNKKELETNTKLINSLFGIVELASTWRIGDEKLIFDELWTSLYRYIYSVEEND